MSDLHRVARSGNLPELRLLVSRAADIDVYDEQTGHTALMAACLSPHAGVDTVRFLLDHGANVHACVLQKNNPVSSIHSMLSDADPESDINFDAMLEGMPVEMRETITQSLQLFRNNPPPEPDTSALISLAVKDASCEKIRLLVERGADVNYRSAHGYTLLTTAACPGREDVIDLLLAAGAPVDGESDYKESALSVLSRRGRFSAIRRILDHGADPSPLRWTPLMTAVALGSLPEVEALLNDGADMETVDFWERTPFLISLHSGDTQKAALLLARGANRNVTGRCGKPPTHYPIDRDDVAMLGWLIEQGFDINQADEFGHSPLRHAVEDGSAACFGLLIEKGADWRQMDNYDEPLIRNATHPEIISRLIELGADAAQLEPEPLRGWIGLTTCDELPVSKEEFVKNRTRRFGNANPERMEIPFWHAMVRCGWAGYRAASQFDDNSFDRGNPVWCHQRFGMSLTKLDDGRFVQIAGEHEDYYDPDFCIYNDVIIHDGKGGFEILGYPEEVFPPTDFHSATLVTPWIYIIGNLGSRHTQEAHAFETPVYRLHIETHKIERVVTRGKSPGWIHRHQAAFKDGCIHLSGGKILTVKDDGESAIRAHDASHALDLETLVWRSDTA